MKQKRLGRSASRSASRLEKVLLCMAAGGSLMIGLFLGDITVANAKGSSQNEIPKDLKIIFEKVGEDRQICPELLEAMCYRESRFIPTAENGNCKGLMQINVKIHKDRIEALGYTAEDMLKAEPNIEVAADYLAELFETYGDDDPMVLMYYSGNWRQVAAYKENGFMCEYVKDVLTRSADYERQHDK